MFEEEDSLSIGKLVSVDEVKYILKLFSKDKSLGPDGWTVEFYWHFSIYLVKRSLRQLMNVEDKEN